MALRSIGKLLSYGVYCVALAWGAYLGLDYWASGVLADRIKYGGFLTFYDGILVNDGDVLRIRPHFNGRCRRPDFDVVIRTNARGFREDHDFTDRDIDVAFMGDSFTFGQGVNVEERYSNQAGAMLPNQTVASLSYNNGFQPEHYEYFLQHHPELRPGVLFVALYLGNDLDPDLRETQIERDAVGNIIRMSIPYRAIYKGAMINAPDYVFSWLNTFISETNIGKLVGMRINASPLWRKKLKTRFNHDNTLAVELGELDQTGYRAITALKRITQIVHERGGKVHVLLIPQNFIVGEAEHPHLARELQERAAEIRARAGLQKTILNACVAEQLTCHDLAPLLAPPDYLPEDGHWNASGHAKIGAYSARLVMEDISK